MNLNSRCNCPTLNCPDQFGSVSGAARYEKRVERIANDLSFGISFGALRVIAGNFKSNRPTKALDGGAQLAPPGGRRRQLD